jgi:hypothetical protein
MLSVDAECCGKCRYWLRGSNPKKDQGLCRRHAPSPTKGQFEHQLLAHLSLLSWHLTDDPEHWSSDWEDAVSNGMTHWPATLDWDWCGEFMPPGLIGG